MKRIILCAVVLLMLALFCGAGSADVKIIYPFTNIADYNSELQAGDVLALINNDGQTSITLSGNGGMVYFESMDFVPGLYSKSIAGLSTSVYKVTRPDASINIQIYDVPGSELAFSNGVSKEQGLVFKVRPLIPIYKPKALLFETPGGGSSTFFGTVNTSIDSETGLKAQGDGSYIFSVKNLRDAGVKSGAWDVRVLYDRSTFGEFNMPDAFLKSSSYGEQMSGVSYSPVTSPTSELIRTVTPTPVKTVVPTPVIPQTPLPNATPEITPVVTPSVVLTEVPTEVPTATPAPSPVPLFSLLAGFGVVALLFGRK